MATARKLPWEREIHFPRLADADYAVTSPYDTAYNCVAWAAGEENTSQWWDPMSLGAGYYWPSRLPRKTDAETFVQLYQIEQGYVRCDHDGLESGFEKVAIYADETGEFTHVARQKEDGGWTSKLGEWEDISHKTLESLTTDDNLPAYGRVVAILKRPRVEKTAGD